MDSEKKQDFYKSKKHEYIRDISSLANPFVLVIILIAFFGFDNYLWVVVAGYLLNELACSLIKFFFPKKRPNKQERKGGLWERTDSSSFPSIHSSRTMFVFLTLALNFDQLYFGLIFLIVPVVVGYSRVYLKKHYWVDVLGGWFVGGVFAWVLWYFF